MRFLLDTHVFLWMNIAPHRLGDRRGLIVAPDSERLLSAASTWEIAIKVGVGKLRLPEPVERWIPTRMRATATRRLPVEHHHAAKVAGLPLHHRDPFDRLLVAQAQTLDVPILTADDVLGRYDVEVLRIGP